jgi:hypothetical protein
LAYDPEAVRLTDGLELELVPDALPLVITGTVWLTFVYTTAPATARVEALKFALITLLVPADGLTSM